mmetsp:Transcript_28091/g.65987  ORF Transcript_28091/g.65987 Transcript_28091/m.65987 type:complete len:239 (+) Transcript_28091:896-1612(+)
MLLEPLKVRILCVQEQGDHVAARWVQRGILVVLNILELREELTHQVAIMMVCDGCHGHKKSTVGRFATLNHVKRHGPVTPKPEAWSLHVQNQADEAADALLKVCILHVLEKLARLCIALLGFSELGLCVGCRGLVRSGAAVLLLLLGCRLHGILQSCIHRHLTEEGIPKVGKAEVRVSLLAPTRQHVTHNFHILLHVLLLHSTIGVLLLNRSNLLRPRIQMLSASVAVDCVGDCNLPC